MTAEPEQKSGWRWLPLRSNTMKHGVLSGFGLVLLAFLASWAEYGYDYAKVVVFVLLGLGIQVWLFLALLLRLTRLVTRRAWAPSLGLTTGLAFTAILLHLVAPVPLRTVSGISAVVAIALFGIILVSRRGV